MLVDGAVLRSCGIANLDFAPWSHGHDKFQRG
jgi:hypothetical protein